MTTLNQYDVQGEKLLVTRVMTVDLTCLPGRRISSKLFDDVLPYVNVVTV